MHIILKTRCSLQDLQDLFVMLYKCIIWKQVKFLPNSAKYLEMTLKIHL